MMKKRFYVYEIPQCAPHLNVCYMPSEAPTGATGEWLPETDIREHNQFAPVRGEKYAVLCQMVFEGSGVKFYPLAVRVEDLEAFATRIPPPHIGENYVGEDHWRSCRQALHLKEQAILIL